MKRHAYKRLRKALGLSQAKLARELGVHEYTISKRERGENPIDREAELALRYLAEKADAMLEARAK